MVQLQVQGASGSSASGATLRTRPERRRRRRSRASGTARSSPPWSRTRRCAPSSPAATTRPIRTAWWPGGASRSRPASPNPFIKSAKGAFFFAGHCHTYERFLKDGKQFVDDGRRGGPRYAVSLGREAAGLQGRVQGAEDPAFHFCELEIQEGALECRMIGLGDDGSFKEMDRCRVEASAPRPNSHRL
ncbi:MAG: hypothetical protein MZV70_05490 [Desulfobacterales bacterium]|nr:hypothetical protein [Desulfobacterales bacterium]